MRAGIGIRRAGAAALLLVLFGGGARSAEDLRPAFDKTPYLKTAWSAANPWWLPNKSRTHGAGGPDFAWHKFSDDGVGMWRQVAERYGHYGLSGLQMEIIVANGGGTSVYKNALNAFEQAGNGLKAQVFMTGCPKDLGKALEQFTALFDKLQPELTTHPNAYRLNGAPVVVSYSPTGLKPEEWKQVIDAVEAKHGRMIWLCNAAHAKPDWLRRYLPVFDGTSMYANWSEEGQRRLFDEIGPVMHDEFPRKIFEAAVHTTYCVHFHYGGVAPRLTRKVRNSWDITLGAEPDALTLTNWFDCYENSRIMPSYEQEDIVLRIARHRLTAWRGEPVPETKAPDLYLANYTNVLLGQPVHVEVLGFPVAGDAKSVSVAVELCDERGSALHRFDERELVLDALRVAFFETSSLPLAGHRALRPRLVWSFGESKDRRSSLFPPTNLVAGLRPHMLFWCRSRKTQLITQGSHEWTLNGVGIGGTAPYPDAGAGVFSAFVTSQRYAATDVNRGGGWVRVLRNGREIESFGNWDLRMTKLFRMPHPGGGLDAYNLELENGNGGRYLSPTIWTDAGTRSGTAEVPVLLPDNSVGVVTIESVRVPYFHYRCDRDTGAYLYDCSGYEHHGYLAGEGYGGGHLARTGYRHDHTGKVGSKKADTAPVWLVDKDGRGCLEFAGSSFVMVQGGTAFPYAGTYELFVKPAAVDKRQGLLGAPNGQVTISITEAGVLEVKRNQAIEGMGGDEPVRYETVTVTGETRLQPGTWVHVAAVYDLRRLRLYLDGELEAEATAAPNRNHEWINAVVLGGTCRFPYTPVPAYAGRMRDVRFYGRSLRPDEFLMAGQR